MRWIPRSLAEGSLRGIGQHVTVTYLIPLGLTFVTAYAGYAQGLPWMWILLAGGVMFAYVTTGLLRFSEWRDRHRVKDKLLFMGLRVAQDLHGGGYGLGVMLHNTAAVPIAFLGEEVRSKIKDRVPAKSFHGTVALVPPGGLGWIADHVIDMTGLEGTTFDGSVELKVKYGRSASDLKYSLPIRKGAVLAFNAEGHFQGLTYHDAA